MEFGALLFLFLATISGILAQYVQESELVINGTLPISHTDANYICATIDWWPDDKCNYNHCPWGSASALKLDLSHPILTKAVRAFEHLRIRVGGSLQDQVVYNVSGFAGPCHPFVKMKGGLFGFSKGCLLMDRWDELNQFFAKTGSLVTFGLNALYGRHHINKGVWGGNWNSSNTRDFIKYTVSKGYEIHSWEFGNELSGNGIGAMVHADQYGNDLIELRGIIDNLYREVRPKPLLVAPGGFFDKEWFAKLLKVTGSQIVDVMTLHLYNLGPGIDPNLVKKILDPHFLSRASITFGDLHQTIQTNGPWASSWVGESGGAYNSGGLHVSDTFVDSFWYLDQLGMAAKYHTKFGLKKDGSKSGKSQRAKLDDSSTFPKLSDLGAPVRYNLGSQEEQVVGDNGKRTTPTQESVVSIDANDPSTMHANVVNSVNSVDATHDTNGPSDVQTCIPRVENTRPVSYINVVPTEPTIVPGLANNVTKEPDLTANTKILISFVKSKDGMDAMLDKDPWFICSTPLILKKWTPDENLLKEDVGNVSVWVKLQNVHILAFSEDALKSVRGVARS
nr:heparanase-like protein 1 [Tanacetum cinerariifolium]